MLNELAFPHIRCCLSAIPSEPMKSTAVDESLSSMNQQFCSRENQLLQIKNQFLALSIAPHVLGQLARTNGQCILQCRSITWISIQTQQSLDNSNLYEINIDRQLPTGIIPVDVLHNLNHKQPHELMISLLNKAHRDVKLLKNTDLGLFSRVDNVDSIHEVSWEKIQTTKNEDASITSQGPQMQKLLPAFPEKSSFQIHANDNSKSAITLQDTEIPQEVRNQLHHMLNTEL